jgi:sugar lactone lactonase YvrE
MEIRWMSMSQTVYFVWSWRSLEQVKSMGNAKQFAAIAAIVAVAAALPAVGARYMVETVVAGSAMHGVHGLAVGPDGALYACSITGHSIYRLDRRSGELTTFVGPPDGICDDLAFAPDGTLAWTAVARVLARRTDGRIVTLATDMPGLNSINYAVDGRLFATRIFGGDGLYEIDPAGSQPPRAVAEKLGGLNGFEVKDGFVYGPLFFRNKVVKVDIETGAVTDVAAGFMQPAAVNFDPQGRLVALDYTIGEVMRLEADGGRKLLATLPPPVDNLAIAPDGKIYVSSSPFNGITEIDSDTLATRRLVWGDISAPGSVVVETAGGKATLVLADAWGPRRFEPDSRTMTALPRTPGVAGATSLALDGDKMLLANVWPFGVVQVVDRTSNKLLANLPGFGAPYGLMPVEGGFLVADHKADRLIHVAYDKDSTRRPLLANLEGPVGIADAGGGAVYVTEYGKKDKRGRFLNGMVSRVDLATGGRTVVARKLNRPEGIAVALDGRLIVAETGARRLIALDPAGKKKPEVLAEKLAIGLAVDEHVPAPFLATGVAVTPDGAIYVTGDVENVLYRIIAAAK